MNLLALLLLIAAVVGDAVNYAVGRRMGQAVFEKKDSKIFKQQYLMRTQKFFDKYGNKAIVLARFVPIVRTFAPFVAGVGTMSYPRFLAYNIVGAFLWVVGFVGAGALVGNMPWVKANFSKVILAIIFLSVLPIALEWLRAWRASRRVSAPSVSRDPGV